MYFSRDPFARTELHKAVSYPKKAPKIGGCDWCGQKDRTLYRYRTESDGGRKGEHRGDFCCKSCHDAYHG